MMATYKSLAEAVPITMASTLITLNDPFRDYELNQAIARVDRIGQPNPVTVVRCYLDTGAEPNISTRSRDILEWSKEQVQQIMGVDLEEGVIMEQFHQTAFEAYQSTGLARLIDWPDLNPETMETAFLPKRQTKFILSGW
jgi:ribosomal protein S10